jgi:copper homeostasis protein
MAKTLVEICCGSVEDVLQAVKGGADRVELNMALCLGGLTPTVTQVTLAKTAGIPVIAMVRPREGGFCYTDSEFQTMLLEVVALIEAGADGIAFGILCADGTVDKERCGELLRVVGDKASVFHRAFDVVPDWRRAMDALIDLRFTRVLSSGQAPTAQEGIEVLQEMIKYAEGSIEVLPGSGIRPANVCEIVERTGCNQVHASLRRACYDRSAQANPLIKFNAPEFSEYEYKVTDVDQVRELIQRLM